MRNLTKFVAVGVLLVPIFVFAAYDDVTLTSSAVIQVGSYLFDVTGSSALIQSITVNSDNFVVTLGSGSSMTISSPTKNAISFNNTYLDVTSVTCNSSGSSITLSNSGSSDLTNTITPSSSVCVDSSSVVAPAGGNGPIMGNYGVSGGGGGGSSSSPSTTPVPQSTAVSSQVQTSVMTFTRDLILGSRGNDVKNLQVFLNTHGFTIASKGAGSSGNETTYFGGATQKALIKFQKANGITPSAGYFGAKTKAVIKKLQ